jgi:UDP-glucose 4-epimerase
VLLISLFNVSSGESRSINVAHGAVRSHLGLPPDPRVKVVPLRDDDVLAVVPAPSMTTHVLRWKAKVDFLETRQRMLSGYGAHGASDVHNHLAVRG